METMKIQEPTEISTGQSFQIGRKDFQYQSKMAKIDMPQGTTTSMDVSGTETILVVEDEKSLLDLSYIMFQSKGYTVITAEDGIQAVELYKQHRKKISLVFTDIGLPGLNGKEVFTQIKKIDPDIKVIFTSGIFVDIKDALIKDGAKDFIPKPYKYEDVLRKIRIVLDAH